jgi:hypothetical protein
MTCGSDFGHLKFDRRRSRSICRIYGQSGDLIPSIALPPRPITAGWYILNTHSAFNAKA